jgi:hypothetical protein
MRWAGTLLLVAALISNASGASSGYTLSAWNDLGMHCVDGEDYSVMSILPPYNNLHAQLVNKNTNTQVTSGVTLTYESVADLTGSINTSSAGKTNFWSYVSSLFGARPADNIGLNLSGNPGNPAASRTPAPMTFNAALGWYEAEGIPMTPYDDTGAKNFYPMVKVVAKDGSGNELASALTVLPVSDEMTCVACHASRSSGTAAELAAQPPSSGWANDPDPQKDWKKNILRIHDDRQRNNPAFTAALAAKGLDPAGLAATAAAGKPILCAGCHADNALGIAPLTVTTPSGPVIVSSLTSALHNNHSQVVDPAQNLKLDDITNRSSCYLCHPGSVTKCLRGAMGNAVDASGNALMGCQSCHGLMKDVGASTRAGWLQQPNCQACHYDGNRATSAIDPATGKLRVVGDTRFATTPNVPASGYSLFRFSTGHGNLQCEACHGATHAEYPSSHENDNVLSVSLQGYRGTVKECSACHTTVPNTTNGGPHGMHTTTQDWLKGHRNAAKNNRTGCAYCHGADYKGTYLSEVRQAKSFSANGTVNFVPGQRVGCYDCHNGPSGSGNRGTLPPNMNPAYVGAAGTALLQADQAIVTWLAAPPPAPPTPGFYTNQFALTGSWYNSTTSGQGLVIEVYPNLGGTGIGVLAGGWFTFDTLGNARWYTVQGQMPSTDASSYALTIYNTTGGNFNAAPIATAVPQGTATLTFYDCSHASLTYQFNDGRSGTISQERISVPTNCTSTAQPVNGPALPTTYTDALHSGAWYDPQTSGQGLFFDIIPAQSTVFAAWFTYAPQQQGQKGTASQRWLTIQGIYTPGNLAVKQAPIYAVTGGLFNTPTQTTTLQVGTADITFTSCTTMTLTYTFTAGEYKGLTGTISEQPVGPVTHCLGPSGQ